MNALDHADPRCSLSAVPTSLAAALALVLVAGGAGCGSDDEAPILTVDVTLGHETGTFTQAPPVTRVNVTATSQGGDIQLSASAPPGGTLDFGEAPVDRLFTFEVTGSDAEGVTRARGRSLSGIYLAAVGGGTIPLFAQRLGQWARPPGELDLSHVGAPSGVVGERFLMVTGGSEALGASGKGDPASSDFYDLFSLGGAIGPIMPYVARSLVSRPGATLLVHDEGAAWIDFENALAFDTPAPTGLETFADVALGRTIEAPDGRSFVVGATRRETPTKAVLIVGADGTLGAVMLNEARAGAAAAWVEDVGLVVAGGSATGAGVEVLAPGKASFEALPFPPDPVEGAGGVVLDDETLTLVGGTLAGEPAPTRALDLPCSSMCVAAALDGASLPVALAGVAAFALDGGRAIVVGDEAGEAGMTRSFLITVKEPGAVELPLREPRRGASVVPAPNGTLALLGGVHADGSPALTVETFFPE